MNLRYVLPPPYKGVVGKETILYCIPKDLTLSGDVCTDGWIVVTDVAVYRFGGGVCEERLAISEITGASCSPQVGSGLLVVEKRGEEMPFARFSMRHIERYSYVGRAIDALCQGDTRTFNSRERERICPKCGHPLPGTNVCPHCTGGWRTMARRFWDLCKGYILPLSCITLFMLGYSAITVLQQYVQRDFVDNVLIPGNGGMKDIVSFFLLMLGLLVVSLAMLVVRTFWSNSLATRISRDMRARVFSKINALSLSFMDSRQTGELINRVVDDSNRIRNFMEETFANMFTQIFTILMAIVAMFTINWKMALLAIVFMPAAAVLTRLFRKKEVQLWRQQRRLDDRVNGRLQDAISGVRVVKSFGKEQKETERFVRQAERLTQVQIRNELFYASLYPFVTFIITIGSLLVIYIGGLQVLNSDITPGTLMQMVAYASMLYGPLGFLTRLPRMLMLLVNALERIYDILDEEPEIKNASKAIAKPIVGDVAFENVTFGYKFYLPVLKDVSFTVKPGEMIGLVGASGSGKSTMINLLMRLYDVNEGRVLIDGHDIKEYTAESLHSQIGVVLQETFLFSGTILDNIRFAKPDADIEEVIRAAKAANAHEFIVNFADGYDTYVGEHGYNLSGGERQRVAIARAILNDPKLLILDEATSSLDTETEFQVQEAMQRLRKGRTTFAIAHRLSTLRDADRIMVLDNQHIAEMGTHIELMRKKGIYYGLVMAQLDMHAVKKQ